MSNNIIFEDWNKVELAEYLADKEVYSNIETALLTDRCDLIEECKEYQSNIDELKQMSRMSRRNNKMIAEFMGIVYPKLDNVIVIDNVVIKEDELQYHISWDWLMPVVEKIRLTPSYDGHFKFGTEVKICGDRTTIQSGGYGLIHHSDFYFNKTFRGQHNTTEATYKAVVQFIKWKNK